MKLTGILVGLFLTLVFVHSLDDVYISCSLCWLRVQIKQRPYLPDVLPQSSELSLGTGCLVSKVVDGYFEFKYPLYACGIRVQFCQCGTLVETTIFYEPERYDVRGILPISCFIESPTMFSFERKKDKDGSSGKKDEDGSRSKNPTGTKRKRTSSSQVEQSTAAVNITGEEPSTSYSAKIATELSSQFQIGNFMNPGCLAA